MKFAMIALTSGLLTFFTAVAHTTQASPVLQSENEVMGVKANKHSPVRQGFRLAYQEGTPKYIQCYNNLYNTCWRYRGVRNDFKRCGPGKAGQQNCELPYTRKDCDNYAAGSCMNMGESN